MNATRIYLFYMVSNEFSGGAVAGNVTELQPFKDVPVFHPYPESVVSAQEGNLGDEAALLALNPFHDLNKSVGEVGPLVLAGVVKDVQAGMPVPVEKGPLRSAHLAVIGAADIASGSNGNKRAPIGVLGAKRDIVWGEMPKSHFDRFRRSTRMENNDEREGVQYALALEAIGSIAAAYIPKPKETPVPAAEAEIIEFPQRRASGTRVLAALVALAARGMLVNGTSRNG
jgi:hypothetical protein